MNASSPALSDFSAWSSKAYLAEYYGSIMPDERYAMEFLVESLRTLPEVPRALDVGCGPCAHHLFPLVTRSRELYAADFVPGNRQELERWKAADAGAHDWSDFAALTLQLEGQPCGPEQVQQRQAATRRALRAVQAADVRRADPLGPEARGAFPLVTAHYVVEAISTDKAVFHSNVANVLGLVAPGGTLILSCCGAADHYKVGEQRFPCSGVTAADVMGCLSALDVDRIDVRVRQTPSHSAQGYASVIFARVTRRG